jgi:hypothetical protein
MFTGRRGQGYSSNEFVRGRASVALGPERAPYFAVVELLPADGNDVPRLPARRSLHIWL